MFQIGLLHFNLSNNILSNENLLKVEEIITQNKINFEEIETLLAVISTNFLLQNELELSLKFRSNLLQYIEDKKGKGKEYYIQVANIADLYNQMGKDSVSLNFNLEIIDFFEKNNNFLSNEYLRIKLNIIHNYINLSRTSDAINLMNEISRLYDDSIRMDSDLFLSFQHTKAKIYSEIGNEYLAHKIYLDCHKYITKNKINDDKYLTNLIYQNLGISSNNLFEYDDAMMFLSLVDTSEFNEHLMFLHKKIIASIFISINQYH